MMTAKYVRFFFIHVTHSFALHSVCTKKKMCVLYSIGIGACPAVLVLAGPLFRQFTEIHYRYLRAHRYRWCSICAHLLQPDN